MRAFDSELNTQKHHRRRRLRLLDAGEGSKHGSIKGAIRGRRLLLLSPMECFLRFTTALLLVASMSNILPCHSSDRLRLAESISGNQTLVSSGGVFVLGFFSPTGSAAATGSWYVGIWHKQVTATDRRVVWVANREKPVTKPPGVLSFSDDRNLVVSDGDGNLVWSSNSSSSSSSSVNDTSAVLLDSGNLVVRKGEGIDLWRSFDHPTDTILPDMSLTLNYRTKVADSITCWRSDRDPSPGNFSFRIDPATSFQFLLDHEGERYWRSQVWTGVPFVGLTPTSSNFVSYLTYTRDDEWVNATFTPSKASAPSMFVLNHTGFVELLRWKDGTKKWSVLYSLPSRVCDSYALCGDFGFCDSTTSPPTCKCLEGFEPRNLTEWDGGDFHGGCSRKKALQCGNGSASDWFPTIDHIKLPDHSIFFGDVSGSDCNKMCSENCSCIAYTHVDSENGSRFNACFVWTGKLVDLVRASNGYHLQVRLAAGTEMGSRTKNKIIILVVIISVSTVLVCASVLCCFLKSRRKKRKGPTKEGEEVTSGEARKYLASSGELGEEMMQEGADLPFLEFELLVAATDNFSDGNRIGRGGFGIVYKGKLANGLEIAIKRLSKVSRQGLEEFKNEVMVIAKLQHRNLVRLLGCCVQEEEKILIYEFLPNGSLDSFLFDNEKRMLLDWKKRFNIIKGIARGLLYLHEDSRLRIIHRDLKAGNILLDKDMNPKISDFGMARIFGGNQNEAETVRVVGTYGYMSPEYAMKGHFSVKSDVYSYGVLVLEILSGERNTSFCSTSFLNLISYAWQLWEANQLVEVVDPLMVGMCEMDNVSRCMLVALLCVQDRASDRPTMSSVVHMLENDFVPLDRRPKQPTFIAEEEATDDDIDRKLGVEIPQSSFSINDVTITELQGRG